MKEEEFTNFSEGLNLKKSHQIIISDTQEPVWCISDSVHLSHQC